MQESWNRHGNGDSSGPGCDCEGDGDFHQDPCGPSPVLTSLSPREGLPSDSGSSTDTGIRALPQSLGRV